MHITDYDENLQTFSYKNPLNPLYKISTESREYLHHLFLSLPNPTDILLTPAFYKKLEKESYFYLQKDYRGNYQTSWYDGTELCIYTLETKDLKEFIEMNQLFDITLQSFVEQKGF